MSLTQTELAGLAANLFDSYDEGFEGDTPLTDDIIARAEAELGYKLPADYTALMRLKNGGSLKRQPAPPTACGQAVPRQHHCAGQ